MCSTFNDILGGIISQIERDEEPASGDIDDEDLLTFDDEESAPLIWEASRATELSALTTKADGLEALSLDDLYTELQKQGNPIKGRRPSLDET